MPVNAGPRSIPARLAPALEALELGQPRVVTTAQLTELSATAGIDMDGSSLAYELRRLGWLLPLRTRGAWEFVPGARAGRFDAGDRNIELRATLAVNPDFPGALAMESAAVALGLARRMPEKEVLSLPRGTRLPKALDAWRVVRINLPSDAVTSINDLPVWTVEALLVGMATRPDGFRDWPNVIDWLGDAVLQADLAGLRRVLSGAPRSVWRRAGYLLAQGGRAEVGLELQRSEPPGTGPVYLGPRHHDGKYDRRFDLIDSALPHDPRPAP